VVVIYRAADIKYLSTTSGIKRKSNLLIYIYFLILLIIAVALLMVVLYVNGIDIKNFNDSNKIAANAAIKTSTNALEANRNYPMVKEIQNVPIIMQFPELPSGCEATAAAMLLNWAGVGVDKQDIAKAMPKGFLPVLNNGVVIGSNPNKVFIGDPFSNSGFGVYHKPVAALINNYLPGQSLDISGTSFQDLLKTIDSGRPVIVWGTVDMVPASLYMSWHDEKGNDVNWIKPEHTFLLIGYSNTQVIVNDPNSGKRQRYPIEAFRNCWESFGKQAVTVTDKLEGKVVTTYITNK
jgi:uncharacterized protein YvpB